MCLVLCFSKMPRPRHSFPKSQNQARKTLTDWFKKIPPNKGRSNIVRVYKPGYSNMDELFGCPGPQYYHVSFYSASMVINNRNFIYTAIDILSIQAEYCFLNERDNSQYYLIRQPYGFDLWIHSNGTDFTKLPLKVNDLSFLFDDFNVDDFAPTPGPSTSNATPTRP